MPTFSNVVAVRIILKAGKGDVCGGAYGLAVNFLHLLQYIVIILYIFLCP